VVRVDAFSGHRSHSLAPWSEKWCSSQSRHVAFEAAASSVENLPAAHVVHSVRLRAGL
jgi:hypothetical protein